MLLSVLCSLVECFLPSVITFSFVPICLVFHCTIQRDKKLVWNILCINDSPMLFDRVSVITELLSVTCHSSCWVGVVQCCRHWFHRWLSLRTWILVPVHYYIHAVVISICIDVLLLFLFNFILCFYKCVLTVRYHNKIYISLSLFRIQCQLHFH